MSRMKAFILLALSVLFLLTINPSAFAESITLTTYYPAPYGVYNELRAKRTALGDAYYDSAANCWPGGPCASPNIPATADLVLEGFLGIGMVNPVYALDVNGSIRATGSVYYGGSVGSANGTAYTKPDYVFEEEYKAMTIKEVEDYLKRENHLPWMTSVKEERNQNQDVIDMTRMTFETAETAENLQLQIIGLNKTAEEQKALIKEQQGRISALEKAIEEIKPGT